MVTAIGKKQIRAMIASFGPIPNPNQTTRIGAIDHDGTACEATTAVGAPAQDGEKCSATAEAEAEHERGEHAEADLLRGDEEVVPEQGAVAPSAGRPRSGRGG